MESENVTGMETSPWAFGDGFCWLWTYQMDEKMLPVVRNFLLCARGSSQWCGPDMKFEENLSFMWDTLKIGKVMLESAKLNEEILIK